ncbi:MAG: hypothetical protein D6714_14755, partial [Bacteroidetes bacterium]
LITNKTSGLINPPFPADFQAKTAGTHRHFRPTHRSFREWGASLKHTSFQNVPKTITFASNLKSGRFWRLKAPFRPNQ